MSSEKIALRNGAVVELRSGDSVPIMFHMAAHSVDVIVTSPPYNLGVDYASGYNDAIKREEYLAWTFNWLENARQVIAPTGSLFLNIWGKPSSPWGPFEVALQARDAGWVLQNSFAWIKHFTDFDAESVGHFKPLNSKRFANDCWELLLHLTPAGETEIDRLAVGVPYTDKSNLTRGNRGKNGDNRCRGNVWTIGYETIKDRATDRPHPATFPPELAERCFKLHGLERIKMTLDPFSGLGSTARAAARLGLNHLGIELGESDHVEAVKRVRAEVEQIRAPATEPTLFS